MKNQLFLNNKGKAGKGTKVLWTVLGIIGAIVIIVFLFGLVGQRVVVDDRVTPGVVPTTCPADLAYSGTVTVQNSLNTTSAEEYDVAGMYFYAIENGQESFATSITDTTSGSVSLECGKEYVARITSGTNNHAYIQSAVMSGGKISQSSGESIRFQVTGGSGNIKLNVPRHGDIQTRMFDRDENGFMANTGSNTTSYNTTDGIIFTSTTDAETNKSVGTGETVRVTLYVQTQSNAREFNDLGAYFLIDAGTSVWDVPSISVNGNTLSVASLAGDEAIAYSAYEYAYAIPQSVKFKAPGEVTIAITLPSLAGVDPGVTDRPQFTLSSKGHYVSVSDSTLLRVGSVQDDTSRTSVYTAWDAYLATS